MRETNDHEPSDVSVKKPFSVSGSGVQHLAFSVEPGHYAFDRFVIKVARSVSDVGRLGIGPSQLVKDGKAVGGAFDVAGGEAVYIGHFGIDCADEPIPWRFYIQGQDEFRKYVAFIREKHPFLKQGEITFRPLETTLFGG